MGFSTPMHVYLIYAMHILYVIRVYFKIFEGLFFNYWYHISENISKKNYFK